MDAPDNGFWTTVGPYACMGVVALVAVIWNGLRDKLKTHDKRINNHSQRLQELDGQKESD